MQSTRLLYLCILSYMCYKKKLGELLLYGSFMIKIDDGSSGFFFFCFYTQFVSKFIVRVLSLYLSVTFGHASRNMLGRINFLRCAPD